MQEMAPRFSKFFGAGGGGGGGGHAPGPPSKLSRFAPSVPRCAQSCSVDNHTSIHF